MFKNVKQIVRVLDSAIDLIKVDEIEIALKYVDWARYLYTKTNKFEKMILNKTYEGKMKQIDDMLLKA